MATYRRIDVAIHSDRRFRSYSDDAKLLWFTLLTAPQGLSIPGVIIAGPAALGELLDWTPERFAERFGELLIAKAALADFEARLVFLPNALKRNPPANPNAVTNWFNVWDQVPECNLKHSIWLALKPFAERFDERFEERFPEPARNGSRNGMANQEQEQEQDQKQDQEQDSPAPVGAGPAPDEATPPRTGKAPPSDDALALTLELRAMVLAANPSAQCSKVFRKIAWGHDLDRLLARYNRPQISYGIHWLGGDQLGGEARFVVESASALASKFDRIASNIKNQIRAGKGPAATDAIDAEIKSLREQGL